MKVSRHLRVSFLTILALCVAVAIVGCSKKDVVSDEPTFSTDDAALGEADNFGAGDAGSALGAGQMQTVYFGYDSYTLTSAAREALKMNAQWLQDNQAVTIQIEGHCDERGTTEYNIALGERRANAVVNYLSRMGVDTSRMSTISYGEERPLDLGHSEDAWAKNRRAEFVVLSQ